MILEFLSDYFLNSSPCSASTASPLNVSLQLSRGPWSCPHGPLMPTLDTLHSLHNSRGTTFETQISFCHDPAHSLPWLPLVCRREPGTCHGHGGVWSLSALSPAARSVSRRPPGPPPALPHPSSCPPGPARCCAPSLKLLPSLHLVTPTADRVSSPQAFPGLSPLVHAPRGTPHVCNSAIHYLRPYLFDSSLHGQPCSCLGARLPSPLFPTVPHVHAMLATGKEVKNLG